MGGVRGSSGGGSAGDGSAGGGSAADDADGGSGGGGDAEGKSEREDRGAGHANLLARLGEMEGTLWTKLAEYHVRSGELELARSVYEESMERVSRVRDFSLVFDAYMKFEEGVVEAMMELMDEDDDDDDDEGGEGADRGDGGGGGGRDGGAEGGDDDGDDDDEDLDILLGDAASASPDGGSSSARRTSADVELALARAEHLTYRRPLLLNRVLLRQNPNNVGEWIKRSRLFGERGDAAKAASASALEEGVRSVDSRRAVNGDPSELWIALAKVHEEGMGDVDSARDVYRRVCDGAEYRFRDSDDLAKCWASWSEMELRAENWDGALGVSRRAVSSPEPGNSTKLTRGLTRSQRLWNLRLDLEESLGTVQTTIDAYDRCIELKVVTPTNVINYAAFLTENKYFEDTFKAYERGLDLFPFPHPGASVLWKAYLEAFLKRYGGTKIHRTRELFDRCVDSCPSDRCSQFYVLYGDFEERYGLTKRALSVYERMCTSVPLAEKYPAYQIYIAKTVKYLGVTASRPLYERAIAALDDSPAARICVEYSEVETRLGEIDRARAALSYGAQLADPRRDPEYWRSWHDFEVAHGNEETFREMLRVKRGVQAAFSTVNYNAAEMGAGVPKVETLTDERALEEIAAREGVKVGDAPRIGGFVKGKRTAEIRDLDEVERRAAKLRRATAGRAGGAAKAGESGDGGEVGDGGGGGGGDEIDIEDDDDDDDNGEDAAAGEGNAAAVGAAAPGAGGGGDDGDDGAGGVRDVTTKSVPAAVFGGLAASASASTSTSTSGGAEDGGGGGGMGALERLRAAAAAAAARREAGGKEEEAGGR